MTVTETQIVDKMLGEIVKVESAADRNPLVNDLSAFLSVVEKRIELAAGPAESVVVTDAEGLVAKLRAAGGEAVAKVKALL